MMKTINKVEIKRENKKIYLKNYYLERNTATEVCSCGMSIKSVSMNPHLKTKKHEMMLQIKTMQESIE